MNTALHRSWYKTQNRWYLTLPQKTDLAATTEISLPSDLVATVQNARRWRFGSSRDEIAFHVSLRQGRLCPEHHYISFVGIRFWHSFGRAWACRMHCQMAYLNYSAINNLLDSMPFIILHDTVLNRRFLPPAFERVAFAELQHDYIGDKTQTRRKMISASWAWYALHQKGDRNCALHRFP